jgi:hypothetical protein
MKPGDPSKFIKHFPLGSELTEFIGKPGSSFILPATGIKTPDGSIYFLMEFESEQEKELVFKNEQMFLTFVGGVPPFSLGGFTIDEAEEIPQPEHEGRDEQNIQN